MSSREQRLEAALRAKNRRDAENGCCCGSRDWRGRLCQYHEGVDVGIEMAFAALGEQEATPPEPCRKCGYVAGCMEPWEVGDGTLIDCGTCPSCRASAPQGEPEPNYRDEDGTYPTYFVPLFAPQGEGNTDELG